MRLVLLVTITFLSAGVLAFEQDTGVQLWQNCNPKVSDEEADFLNRLFPVDTYDFKNKTVAFADNYNLGGYSRRNIYLVTKKEFFGFINKNKDLNYRFIIFTPALKSLTYGFDVLAIATTSKLKSTLRERKINRFIMSISYRELNYPDNISSVGNDTSEMLNGDEVIFLNSLFRNYDPSFDFKNKKVAFVTNHSMIISKKEYIMLVKEHLKNDFLYPPDHIYMFSEKEKMETGGYDCAVILFCPKIYPFKIINNLKAKAHL